MNDVRMAGQILVRRDLGFDLALVTLEGELERRILAERTRRAGDHHRWAGIPAHSVDGDAGARHDWAARLA